ncbi:MAG: 3-isopropylmalate dehydratase small subunit [Acidobacteriota bacterium]
MDRVTRIESITVPLSRPNIDTDQILPARFLQKPRSGGFGQYLFHDLRLKPDFVLNQPVFRDARILVAGENFGCGSSRENAVWALHDYGFRAVIAPSMGDIFTANCLKNGLLPIILPAPVVATILTEGQILTVDLESQTVSFAGESHTFEIDAFVRHCLLHGIDELDYTLSRMPEIEAFEKGHLS